MIEVNHLSFSFGRHWVLKDVTFSVGKGEFVFLTGPSGAGKTTLMRVLHGALPVTRGNVSVAGFALAPKVRPRVDLLRRKVSVVFQDFKILPDRTAFQNVMIPLHIIGLPPSRAERRVRAVLRSLQLEDKADVPCRELSGGEQQRVAIARAVVVNPAVLLADEPTGNLDRSLAMRLLAVFRQFHLHGTTIVLATHNHDVLKSQPGGRILQLNDGRIEGEYTVPGGGQ
ncbi:MAG: ATP-binding cassette domain-containing protein [Deltaproteobacteria bacterium]|nr:ATP-binding cassette domain-containing protein [Deltaproteobacteria bacterium]